jgi:hypothetical protein
MSKIVLTYGNKLVTLDTIDDELTLRRDILKFVKEAGTEARVNLIVREEAFSTVLESLYNSSKPSSAQSTGKFCGLYLTKI